MPRRHVDIEPALLSEVERIRQEGARFGQSDSSMKPWPSRSRNGRAACRCLCSPTDPLRRPDRDEILSVLDF